VTATDGFDEAIGLLDYPMYVATTIAAGEKSGCLVGFGSQASIDPARFLVGISDKNHTFRVASAAERLVVHLLSADRRDLAELFGERTGDEVDKFTRCDWQPGPGGVPVLTAAAAWFSGPIVDRHRLGDHVGFLIEPDSGEVRAGSGRTLMFSDVKGMSAGHEA
jgi:flavin reductase (DIM6/NTAB) family NADH-FMN oxidoreductase RutF